MEETPRNSQTTRAILQLRELILNGELKPGERVPELGIVERLGVSRTPVRLALARLQEEGLVDCLSTGGFVVREFSEADIIDAIDLRGALEGMAARRCAERRLSRADLAEVRDCLGSLDSLVRRPELSMDDFEDYIRLNERFHGLLVELVQQPRDPAVDRADAAHALRPARSLRAGPVGTAGIAGDPVHRPGPSPLHRRGDRSVRAGTRRNAGARALQARPAQPSGRPQEFNGICNGSGDRR